MIYIWIIASITGVAIASRGLSYTRNDTVLIPFGQNFSLSSFMSTSSNEYVSEGEIRMTTNLTQVPNDIILEFNILYFNLQSVLGLSCYRNYFNNVLVTSDIASLPCANHTIEDLTGKLGCFNLTRCKEEFLHYDLRIESSQFQQDVIVIENFNPSNNLTDGLHLETSCQVTIQASVNWFYAAIALTCLLLINIVLLTGVSLYWILEYRKTNRLYEQFRLTTDADQGVQLMDKSHSYEQ